MEFVSLPPAEELPPLDAWYPWPPGRPWLRCMMVMSLDGGFRGSDGRSHALSSAADQRVLLQGRRFAHAVIIGAETMRRERYQALRCGNDATREEAGLDAEPALVIVSASLDLPWDDGALADRTSRPIVVTTQHAPAESLRRAQDAADVIVLPSDRVGPGDRVAPQALIEVLRARGLFHLVCEGGPHLLADLIRAHVVDEADITIAPLLAGGGQIVTASAMDEPIGLQLASLLEHRGWLFSRYVRVER